MSATFLLAYYSKMLVTATIYGIALERYASLTPGVLLHGVHNGLTFILIFRHPFD